MSRYTFFELATQNGFVVSEMRDRVTRYQQYSIVVIGGKRVYQAFTATHIEGEEPFFSFEIPDRELAESTLMWQERVREELTAAWNAYKAKSGMAVLPSFEKPAVPPEDDFDIQAALAEALSAPPPTEDKYSKVEPAVPMETEYSHETKSKKKKVA